MLAFPICSDTDALDTASTTIRNLTFLEGVTRVVGGQVAVDQRRVERLKAAVRLKGLPKGRFTVKITVRLANGKKVTGKRVYHTCIPRLPGDGPPKV